MSQKFKIIRDYYDTGEKIFDKSYVEFNPGVTVLVGCNGSGKTTLLHQIKSGCKEKNIPCLEFDNYHNGGRNATSYAGFVGDYSKVARDIMSSEGEKINDNIALHASRMGGFVRDNINAEKIFFLFDAADSGLSIDYVLEMKKYLFEVVLNDCATRNIETYIIISCNEFEMARGEQCFDVGACKYVDIANYDDYRALIIATRKKKDRRYKLEEFNLE